MDSEPAKSTTKKLYSVSEAATYLSKTKNAIYKAIQRNQLTRSPYDTENIRFSKDDLDTYLESLESDWVTKDEMVTYTNSQLNQIIQKFGVVIKDFRSEIAELKSQIRSLKQQQNATQSAKPQESNPPMMTTTTTERDPTDAEYSIEDLY